MNNGGGGGGNERTPNRDEGRVPFGKRGMLEGVPREKTWGGGGGGG